MCLNTHNVTGFHPVVVTQHSRQGIAFIVQMAVVKGDLM